MELYSSGDAVNWNSFSAFGHMTGCYSHKPLHSFSVYLWCTIPSEIRGLVVFSNVSKHKWEKSRFPVNSAFTSHIKKIHLSLWWAHNLHSVSYNFSFNEDKTSFICSSQCSCYLTAVMICSLNSFHSCCSIKGCIWTPIWNPMIAHFTITVWDEWKHHMIVFPVAFSSIWQRWLN